LIALNDN
jgi:ankyrin repeat protein